LGRNDETYKEWKMKLALEATASLLPKIQAFGDFDWISYPRMLKKDKEYIDFCMKSEAPRTLNLGDGCASIDIKQIKDIWEALGSPIMVAPSLTGNYLKTIQAYDSCCEEYGVENVIGVVAGTSYQEIFACVNYYKGQIAVPFDIGSGDEAPNYLMALRRALIVSNIPADRWVHLLGFTTINELEWYMPKPNVLSINTGYPILLGLQEKDILDIDNTINKPKTTLSIIEEEIVKKQMSQTQWTAIIRNIALLRRYLS